MAIRAGEILEVNYKLPNGTFKPHPALVISHSELHDSSEKMFYAVLISTKNHHPEYTIKIEDEWLNKPMTNESYFVTHIVSFFGFNEITSQWNQYLKEDYLTTVIYKVIENIFGFTLEDVE